MPEDEPVVASTSRLQVHAMRGEDDEDEDDEDDEDLSDMDDDVEETLVGVISWHVRFGIHARSRK